MIDYGSTFLLKAQESLAGAQSEYANTRYNNAANRAYYACFQAAIHALVLEGVIPHRTGRQWGHDFVQAEFAGRLINRRRIYPSELRDVLMRASALRLAADYGREFVSERQVSHVLRRAADLVTAVLEREGKRS